MKRSHRPAPRTTVWLAVLVTAGILAAAGAAPHLSLQRTIAAGRGAAAGLARAGAAWRRHARAASAPSAASRPAAAAAGRPVHALAAEDGITVTAARRVPGTGAVAAWIARARGWVVGAQSTIAARVPGEIVPLGATVAGVSLALLGLAMVHGRRRGRGRSAARMLRRGASPARVGRRTRLAQDAVRFIESSERA